jgi:XTP/dITP diphosphohydrolase
MELLFASANQNKIREITQILTGRYKLFGLTDLGITEEIPEPGNTIKENAYLKAKYVSEKLKNKQRQIAVFADDSGLEVEALQNAPGVYSARYAGIPKNDENNNKKLLAELNTITNRKARFVTVITLMMNDEVHYFEGEIKGTIAFEPRGSSGFGYDPLFIPQGYRSTFAELSAEVKNTISHRAMAVKKLTDFLVKTVA